MTEVPKYKVCTKCGEEQPLKAFAMRKGYNTPFKVCNRCRVDMALKNVSGDPKKYLSRLLVIKRSRAKTGKGHRCDLTLDDLLNMYEAQEGRCSVSGVKLKFRMLRGGNREFNASIDRIDSSLPYTADNVQLVCNRVNIMKGVLPSTQLYWWIDRIQRTLALSAQVETEAAARNDSLGETV